MPLAARATIQGLVTPLRLTPSVGMTIRGVGGERRSEMLYGRHLTRLGLTLLVANRFANGTPCCVPSRHEAGEEAECDTDSEPYCQATELKRKIQPALEHRLREQVADGAA